MKHLNPMHLDFNNNSLIEASAGTGKTFTITTLYLRLVLGLAESPNKKPLTVDDVLVVTFTDAATQELRHRIRLRLTEAQHAMMAGYSEDNVLNEIVDTFLQQLKGSEKSIYEQQLRGYHILQRAITLLDDAPIFTIHGFCSRCLTQFAFETKSNFDLSLSLSSKVNDELAFRDFWRKFIAPLQGWSFSIANALWSTAQSMQKQLSVVLHRDIVIKPVYSEHDFQTDLSRFIDSLTQFQTVWQQQGLYEALLQAGFKKNNKQFTRLELLNSALQSVEPHAFWFEFEWQIYQRDTLSQEKLYTKGKQPFDHPSLNIIEDLKFLSERLTGSHAKAYWLNLAKTWITERGQRLNAEMAMRTPDDLLTELDLALRNDPEGRLTAKLRQRYPIAFIDEFQDTDPTQYRIFSHIYSGNDTAMVLIGDPKQAIYKFRGADIYTYLIARQQIGDENLYTLNKNWRSHPSLIASLNALYRTSDMPFNHKNIAYVQIEAGRQQEQQLLVEGRSQAKLELWQLSSDNDKFNLQDSFNSFAKWCAIDIKQILSKAVNNQAHIVNKQGELEALQSKDICVLVRDRHQAKLVKQSLSEQGIGSVFLNKDSVFNSELAKQCYVMLKALNDPFNERFVKSACAGPMLHYKVSQLEQLMADANQWQAHLSWFSLAHEHWQKGKIGQAFWLVLNKAKTLTRWQLDPYMEFERTITDVRHIIELLQVEANQGTKGTKLIQWLAQQITNPVDANDHQVRLESDDELVKIVTLHGSKGLEYPLVYMPMAYSAKNEKQAIYLSEGSWTWDLTDDPNTLEQAELERLAEDARLLYVGLTRPIHRLVVGYVNAPLAKTINFTESALAKLIMPTDTDSQATDSVQVLQCAIEKRIEWLNTEYNADIAFLARTDDLIETDWRTKQAESINNNRQLPLLSLNRLSRAIKQTWQSMSYSSLLTHQTQDTETVWRPGAADEIDTLDQIQSNDATLTPYQFPKGANPGSCLHSIFESVDFNRPVSEQTSIIEQQLQQFGIGAQWQNCVVEWTQNVLDVQLPNTLRLSQLESANKLIEMEFYLNVEQFSPHIFDNALRMIGVNSAPVSPSWWQAQQSTQGVIKGFIDLTYQWQGKFYVLDYKSNYLGPDSAAYNDEAMANAMLDHNYYLQALIYTLALHRMLKNRLPNYEYNAHIGGYQYLFLRGIAKEQGVHTGIFANSIPKNVIEYIDAALLGEQHSTRVDNCVQPTQVGFDFD